MTHKVMDLFCGTGGFSYGVCEGLKNARVVLGIDTLEPAIGTFSRNNPEANTICGDITKYPPEAISDEFKLKKSRIDVIIGGPPCQGFSSIRPNRSKNHDDLRNFLYLDFIQYVNFFQPPVFIMENVVGLATHKNGKTLKSILNHASKIGYHSDWKILNAANFGIPQRRERLIMIGLRDREDIEFPKPTHFSEGSTIGYYDKSKVVSVEPTLCSSVKIKKAVTTWEAISDLPPLESGEEKFEYYTEPQNDYQRKMRKNSAKLDLHYATNHSKRMIEIIKHSGYSINNLPEGMVSSGFSTSYSRIEPDMPSVTLTGNFPFPGSNKCIHPFQHRAITLREAARIQSFPDDYKFIGTKSQIAKQIGNAVPPLFGDVIGKIVKKYL